MYSKMCNYGNLHRLQIPFFYKNYSIEYSNTLFVVIMNQKNTGKSKGLLAERTPKYFFIAIAKILFLQEKIRFLLQL